MRAVAPDEPFPQAYGAMATVALPTAMLPTGGQQRMAYLAPLTNPTPEKLVVEVRFVPGTLRAKPLLLGLATRSVWSADR